MKKTKLSLQLFLSAHLAATALITAAVPMAAHAQAPLCADIFSTQSATLKLAPEAPQKATAEQIKAALETNYQNRNAILVKRYPKLEFVFKDPEAFVQTMKSRFEAQKKITPEDPRLFHFPEAASTMHEIKADLAQFRQELIVELQAQKASLRNRLSHTVLGKRSAKVEAITKVLQYTGKLQRDIDTMISSDNYPYRDTIYTLYYYSRIRGIFQFKDLSNYYQVMKYLDMSMHGYRRLNVDAELKLYKEKGSPIVQVRSGKVAAEFRSAELPFRDAFERTDALEYVIIPSVYALGSSAFLHVLPHNIHFLGATNTPVPADGFNRPGGLFWMHDVRHEADRYMKINSYRKAQNLTRKQDEQLTLLMHQWHADFLNMKNSVQDANLKAALDHYHFYTHHDVGVPLIPSMFLNHHMDGMAVYYGFLVHKKMAGQTPGYTAWLKTTRQAQEILTKFWQERLPLEKSLLQKDPVKIKNWDEWFPLSHQESKTPTAIFNKAIETGSLVRVRTNNTGVDGVLSKVIYNEEGNAIYMNFSEKAQLIDRADRVITGQGVEVHGKGYSTPIGKIKSVTIDGRMATLDQVRENQQIEIQYESGIVVRGELSKRTSDETGALTVLTFRSAEASLNGKALYKPEWGSFDLLLGEKIESIELL